MRSATPVRYSLKHNNDRVFAVDRATGVLRLARPAGILSNPVFAQVPDRNIDWYVHSALCGGGHMLTNGWCGCGGM